MPSWLVADLADKLVYAPLPGISRAVEELVGEAFTFAGTGEVAVECHGCGARAAVGSALVSRAGVRSGGWLPVLRAALTVEHGPSCSTSLLIAAQQAEDAGEASC